MKIPILTVRDAEGNIVSIPAIKGEKGDDGHTPVKGTDYWTASDKSAVVADVLSALPTWNGGSY